MRFVTLLVFLAACTSSPETRGVVRTMPARGDDGAYVPGEPIGGARVELACPDASPEPLGETDSGGLFAQTGERLPLACALRVSRAGYAPRTIPVADVCADPAPDDACRNASVTARLVPEPAP